MMLLTTCAEPVNQDYTQRFPVGAVPETVSVPAQFVGSADPFAGAQEQRLDTLVRGYLDSGHGPLTIAASAANPRAGEVAAARMASLRQRLIADGVPASEIRLQLASEGAPDTVTLSYERYTAVLPTCGDWSTETGFNPNNTLYPNFGCAQQHNLGAMVADPADLVSSRASAPSDPQDTARVTRDYRLGSPAPESAKNAIEGSADSNAASGSGVGNGGSTR
jgi:pilus assembly protein CpaD